MTNLTSLDVRLRKNQEIAVEPLRELKKIERLRLPYHLYNKDGELLFPDLTNLQHLPSTFVQIGLNRGEGSIEVGVSHCSVS